MAQVIMPQKKKDTGLSSLLQVGGAVAGGVIGSAGGPGGALTGAATGASLGGAAGGLLSQNDQQQQIGVPNQASALERRQQKMSPDNLAMLQQAEVATASLPEPLRQEYLPALTRARLMAERQGGMV